jgi:hypothetical protein
MFSLYLVERGIILTTLWGYKVKVEVVRRMKFAERFKREVCR